MLVPRVSLLQGSHISSVQWILYQKHRSDLQVQTWGEDSAFVWVNKLVTVLIRDSSWRLDRTHSLKKKKGKGNSVSFIIFRHSDQTQGMWTVLWKPLLCEYCIYCILFNRIFFSFNSLLSGLILLFYAALYTFLAAMFGGCLFCLMWSISPYHPTFNDRVMPPGKYIPILTSLHLSARLSFSLLVLLESQHSWLSLGLHWQVWRWLHI